MFNLANLANLLRWAFWLAWGALKLVVAVLVYIGTNLIIAVIVGRISAKVTMYYIDHYSKANEPTPRTDLHEVA